MVRLNVQCVDDTRNVTQDREKNVDEEVCIATSLEENTERREDNGKNDLADIAGNALSALRTQCAEGDGSESNNLRCGERHVDGSVEIEDLCDGTS